MAWHTIIHNCGHVAEHDLRGSYAERQGRERTLGRADCWDCRKAAQSAAARVVAEQVALPALAGSDKQTAWAESLRLVALDELARHKARVERLVRVKGLPADLVDAFDVRVDALVRRQVDARWWIDRRPGHAMLIADRARRDVGLEPLLHDDSALPG
jgi:hypothetical protein